MPRHTPRTIWKPVYSQAVFDIEAAAPIVTNVFSIRAVDADASMGLVLKRLSVTACLGLISSVEQDNNIATTGFMSFFKWPADAAAPTDATIDMLNRTSVISRTPFALVGVTPQRFTLRMKSARLKMGEELWYALTKMSEDATTTDLAHSFISQHWETQA